MLLINKYINQARKIRKWPLSGRFGFKLSEARNIDVSPVFPKLGKAVKLVSKFMYTQVKIRPRLKVAIITILSLIIIFQLSSEAVSALKPREAEIKINGKAILVAQDQGETTQAEVEINQDLHAKLSPFEFRMPIPGVLSQGYAYYHRANDIAGPLGSPIYPVGAGVIEFAGRVFDGKGNIVVIDHGDGLKSLYAHMGKIEVGVGNTVDTKTAIGTVGLTGHTTGPHVHLEIYDHDVAVNPASVLPDDTI